ncbi:TetR/AcrR family transcriptional regulator [Nocardia sp. XZ_19_385]|uniref:TetR/AcrR family transcriptional regulator n=1 Tax=Nocardia sp. XZ_19_385 TaxID=2769488 RepID=UPI00188DE697|nr:TetR/AcrR family transcriptional regulator [Nocardia sp. XZ_19_385]
MGTSQTRHSYSGQSVLERRAERRALFIEAALTVFAGKSYAKSSVTEICSAAGLSRRQFYEEYASREDLLMAAYDAAQQAARAAVATAAAETSGGSARELVSAGLTAYLAAMVSDIRRAKVAYVEVVGVSDRVEQHRLGVRDEWARTIEAIAANLPEVHTPACGWPTAMAGFIGALNGAAHHWSMDEQRPPVRALVEMLSTLLFALLIPAPAED